MPFLTAPDGVEVHYEVEGEGFPLVFTHGNMGFGQQFFLQTRILSKKYRCILHDLRGCGLSGKPEAEIYDTKIHSSDLHTILKDLGVQEAIHLDSRRRSGRHRNLWRWRGHCRRFRHLADHDIVRIAPPDSRRKVALQDTSGSAETLSDLHRA